jgi:hypothetical protein
MLDNVVSPINCVSMNHQNQLEQMENGAIFATRFASLPVDANQIRLCYSELLFYMHSLQVLVLIFPCH